MLGGLLRKLSGSNGNSPVSSPRSWRSSSAGRPIYEPESTPNIEIMSVIDTFVEQHPTPSPHIAIPNTSNSSNPSSPHLHRISSQPSTPSSPRKIITAIFKRASKLKDSSEENHYQRSSLSSSNEGEDFMFNRYGSKEEDYSALILSEGWFSLLPPEMRLEIFNVWIEENDWKTLYNACLVNSRWNREINELWRKSFDSREREGIPFSRDEEIWLKFNRNWKWIMIMMTKEPNTNSNCNFSFGSIKSSENNELRFEGVYEGEWKNGTRNGVGRLWWTNTDRYIGRWKEDKKNGKGTMVWANGDKYSGEWKDDQRHGSSCKYTYSVGGLFKGTYHKDERHGPGMYTWPDGDRFIGDWKNGGRVGKGLFITNDGTRFNQTWKEEGGVSYSEKLPNKYPLEEIPQSM